MTFPPKTNQIEAVIHGTCMEFALEHVPMEPGIVNQRSRLIVPYSKVFNITKKEIKEYLISKYAIEDLVPPYPKEGLFAEREKDGFRVYEQDYGRICNSWFVKNREGLIDAYIKFQVDRSCVDIKL